MAWHTWSEEITHHAQNHHQYRCDNNNNGQYQKDQYYHHQEQHYHQHHFSHPSRPPLKGTLVLFPPSWDTISEFWKEIAALGPKIPCRKRLVLYFVFRGTSLRVCLGDAKAAGLLCVLGIGLGLGSLLIYRLFKKYQCSDELPNKSNEECYMCLESIDSIFNKEEMGQTYAHHDLPSAHYTPNDGVSFILDPSKRRSSQDTIHIDTPVRYRRLGPNYHSNNNYTTPAETAGGSDKMVLCDQSLDSSHADNTHLHDLADDSSVSSYPRSVTSSLMGNYSPRSLRERNLVFDGSVDDHINENITNSSEKSFKDVLRDNLEKDSSGLSKSLKGSSVLLTPPSEEDSPSLPHRSLLRQSSSVDDDYDYEVKSENSRNLHLPLQDMESDYFSDTFSSMSRRDWSSAEEDGRDSLSPLSPVLLFSPDQFPNILRNRLREFKSPSPESPRSGSSLSDWIPNSDPSNARLERCDSIDSSIADIITGAPQEIEEIQEERFHGIEDELQDLTSEMDELMSGLSSLKSKCAQAETPDDDLQMDSPTQVQSPISRQAFNVLQRARSRWERRASSLTPESDTDDFRSHTLEPALSLDMTGNRLGNYPYNNESNVLSPSCLKYVPFSVGVDSDNNYDPNSDELFLNNQRLYSTREEKIPIIVDYQVNVGRRQEIQVYAQNEWKGDTPKALTIRKGYAALQERFHCHYLRQIRGDNYCAMRGCVAQILVHKISIKEEYSDPMHVKKLLREYFQNTYWELESWSFAKRLTPHTDVLSMMEECIDAFYDKIEQASQIEHSRDREKWVETLFNSDLVLDVKMMEAAKLLMLVDIIEIYKQHELAAEIPVFAWLLFARETSTTPADLIKNHLNMVGNTGGLEQVEMFLLGHALGVTIQVARLYQYGHEDFICYYPDEINRNWSNIILVAEDDRHYNMAIMDEVLSNQEGDSG